MHIFKKRKEPEIVTGLRIREFGTEIKMQWLDKAKKLHTVWIPITAQALQSVYESDQTIETTVTTIENKERKK